MNRFPWVLAFAVAVSGCPRLPPRLPSHAAQCRAFCTRLHTCANESKNICMRLCVRRNGARANKLRPDYVREKIKCLRGCDCTTVKANRAISMCERVAAGRIAPSPAALGFCTRTSARAAACGFRSHRARCLSVYKVLVDEILHRAAGCLRRPCARIGTCIGKVLGNR